MFNASPTRAHGLGHGSTDRYQIKPQSCHSTQARDNRAWPAPERVEASHSRARASTGAGRLTKSSSLAVWLPDGKAATLRYASRSETERTCPSTTAAVSNIPCNPDPPAIFPNITYRKILVEDILRVIHWPGRDYFMEQNRHKFSGSLQVQKPSRHEWSLLPYLHSLTSTCIGLAGNPSSASCPP